MRLLYKQLVVFHHVHLCIFFFKQSCPFTPAKCYKWDRNSESDLSKITCQEVLELGLEIHSLQIWGSFESTLPSRDLSVTGAGIYILKSNSWRWKNTKASFLFWMKWQWGVCVSVFTDVCAYEFTLVSVCGQGHGVLLPGLAQNPGREAGVDRWHLCTSYYAYHFSTLLFAGDRRLYSGSSQGSPDSGQVLSQMNEAPVLIHLKLLETTQGPLFLRKATALSVCWGLELPCA